MTVAPPVNEVHFLIAEAIDAVAAPMVRKRVIERAIEIGDCDGVPADGRPVRIFIREHLASALAESFDTAVAATVVDSLSPLMERSTGAGMTGLNQMPEFAGPLATTSPVEPTLREPASPKLRIAAPRRQSWGKLATVVVFSENGSRPSRMARTLGDDVVVCHCATSLDMLDALREHDSDGSVVVVDCVESSVEPWALIALGGQIPCETRLLFWGASPDFELELAPLDGRRWRTVSAEATAENVARFCEAVVRGPGPE